MDLNKIIQDESQKTELHPNRYDGSYELLQSVLYCYSVNDTDIALDYHDVYAIYSMTVGTWTQSVQTKKEIIAASHLLDDLKQEMYSQLDSIWDAACRRTYQTSCEAIKKIKKPAFGLFEEAPSFDAHQIPDSVARDFIKYCLSYNNSTTAGNTFNILSSILCNGLSGITVDVVSAILHCASPSKYPVISFQSGYGRLFSALGVELVDPEKIENYCHNCAEIEKYCHKHYDFSTYFIYEIVARKLLEELNISLPNPITVKDAVSMRMKYDKNLILYGPPGTGKTYNTIIYAVAIIENKSIDEVKTEAKSSYEAVKKRYDAYKADGQIAFTTFHQSYGYEEFIQGIKPKLSEDPDSSELDYTVEDGIFKRFCERALISHEEVIRDIGLNKAPVVWKVSLAGTYDNPVREECLANNHIRLGFDSYGAYPSEEETYKYGGRVVLNGFMNKMRIGDIVLSCYSASTIDAIGVITGEYTWVDHYDAYKRVRDVKWLVKGIKENIVEMNDGYTMTLSSVYRMRISVADVLNLVEKNTRALEPKISALPSNKDNYVFIIDEINRGNISKIFGELITLIEPTKRLGAKEETTVALPYSPNQNFGVPDNVYLIGTMNTADRSIALMDTALRRRFSFVEMLPDTEVLRTLGIADLDIEGHHLDVLTMLKKINKRIEFLYDREHMIGHAFFTGLKDDSTLDKLKEIFSKNVIPLLQEYFYEDYEKISLVLGDNGKTSDEFKFILKQTETASSIFNGSPELDALVSYVINKKAFDHIESYLEI